MLEKKHNAKSPQNLHRKKPSKHRQINELHHYMTKGRKPNFNYLEHLDAGKINEYVGNDICNNYQ